MNRQNKVWLHYVKNIIAADVSSAVFLASYLRYSEVSRDYTSSFELFDLQKYKIISQPSKVRQAIDENIRTPFIFLSGKN